MILFKKLKIFRNSFPAYDLFKKMRIFRNSFLYYDIIQKIIDFSKFYTPQITTNIRVK